MKVAFDHNVPPTVAKLFLHLANEKVVKEEIDGLKFTRSQEYAPRPTDRDYIRKSDVPWLDRFAKAGGHAVITGDVKMRKKPHERLALYQHGFVTIFFHPEWNNWNFYKKSALLLHWWEEICAKIKTADKGTFWAVPCAWPPKDGELVNVSFGLARLLKDNPAKKRALKDKSKAIKKRGMRRLDNRQTELLTNFTQEGRDENTTQLITK